MAKGLSRISRTIMCAMLAFALLLLAGCGGGGTSYPQIGEKGEGTIDVVVTNALSSDIDSLKTRPTGTDNWGEELLPEGMTIAPEAVAELHLANAADAKGIDFLIGLAEGDDVEIHSVDLASMKALSFSFEDEVGFVTFKDADGNEGSTKDAALAEKKAEEEAKAKEEEEKRKAEEEAKKKEEEEKRKAEEEAARQAEEEAAAAAAAAEEEVYYEESYSEDYYEPSYSYSEPSYSEPEYSAPAQTEMECTRENTVLDNI